MVTVPVLGEVDGFAGHESASALLPVPLEGLTVSQLAELDAVHAQFEALAVSDTVPLHAAAPGDAEEPDRVYVQAPKPNARVTVPLFTRASCPASSMVSNTVTRSDGVPDGIAKVPPPARLVEEEPDPEWFPGDASADGFTQRYAVEEPGISTPIMNSLR